MSEQAFGAPGTPPTWSSSHKDIVTTALDPSRRWVTGGHGSNTDVLGPTTARPQIRDLPFNPVAKRPCNDAKRCRK